MPGPFQLITTVFAVLGILMPLGGASAGRGSDAAYGGPAQFEAVEQTLAAERTGRLAPDVRSRLAHAIVAESRAHALEPDLVMAVIRVESTFDHRAVSRAGAYGLMQVRPQTGRALARRIGVPWAGIDTLLDPVSNVRIGIAYLARLRDRFGDVSTALAAYNWGPTRLRRRLGRGEPIPARYTDRVLQALEAHTQAPRDS